MDNKRLLELHQHLGDALRLVAAELEGEKCLHDEAMELTTMGGPENRKFWCSECGESWEEEFDNELEP